MASDSIVGAPHSRAARLGLADTLTRRELFLWLACILFANQLLAPPQESQSADASWLAQTFFARSVFYYLGWYAVVTLLWASNPAQPASKLDWAITLSAASSNLLPALNWNWLPTTALALFLAFSRRSDDKAKAATAVMLALCFNGYWAPKFFDFFAYYLLRADAALVGAALYLTQPGMGWDETIIGRPGGHSVLIFSPCSSFHNISLGLLCWVSVTKLTRTSWVRGDFAVAIAVCATVILFNAVRLYLMALSNGHYVYWHQGPGEQVMAWGTTMAVLLISLWGAVRRGKRG